MARHVNNLKAMLANIEVKLLRERHGGSAKAISGKAFFAVRINHANIIDKLLDRRR